MRKYLLNNKPDVEARIQVYLVPNLLLRAVVPERVIKKQKRDADALAALKTKRETARKERVEKRKVYMSNAEKYYKAENDAVAQLVKAKRDARKAGDYFVEAQPKVAFVIRIKG